jgi:hypothetical protein
MCISKVFHRTAPGHAHKEENAQRVQILPASMVHSQAKQAKTLPFIGKESNGTLA